MVGRHSIDPGENGVAVLELRHVPQEPHEDFLGGVLRPGPVAQQAQATPVDDGSELTVETGHLPSLGLAHVDQYPLLSGTRATHPSPTGALDRGVDSNLEGPGRHSIFPIKPVSAASACTVDTVPAAE